jgi:hypothetical protein
MYSKEEFKQLKKDFWTKFGLYSQLKRIRLGLDKKWMLYKTGLKGLELKFILNESFIMTAIDIDTSSSFYEEYFKRIELLKHEIKSSQKLDLQEGFFNDNHKESYRYYFKKEGLNFKNTDHWPEIFEFYFKNMKNLELFIIDNKDILEIK